MPETPTPETPTPGTPTPETGARQPTALVTGASRGIGAALTLGLLDAGWRVAALARDTARLEALAPGNTAVLPIGCDVTDEPSVHHAVGQAIEGLGNIDLLVNNAGANAPESTIWDADPEQWWGIVETNVRGPFLLTRAVVPAMITAGGGRVVNINSGAGVRDFPDISAYNASKTALCRITTATADAGAPHGVHAFDLAPGVVKTDMTKAMKSHEDRTQWTDPQVVVELLLALASGDLDAYSGAMVRAGADDVATLIAHAPHLEPDSRRLRLRPWGHGDPLA